MWWNCFGRALHLHLPNPIAPICRLKFTATPSTRLLLLIFAASLPFSPFLCLYCIYAKMAESVSSMDQHASPSLALRHPAPDLQSLQGAYVGNVERLEHEAERLSSGGSDLAENIRQLKAEQRLSESRRASLRSAPNSVEEGKSLPPTRSRGASTSSYSNSIVDVNAAARWGGYVRISGSVMIAMETLLMLI